MSFQAMRRVLLARATAATLGGLRLSNSRSHGEELLRLFVAWRIQAMAPLTSTARKRSSPARVMPPSFCRPAVEWSLGVSPIQAAQRRPERKAWGSTILVTNRQAPIGPIVGT